MYNTTYFTIICINHGLVYNKNKDNLHHAQGQGCLPPEITLQLLSENLFATMGEIWLTLKLRLLHMLILLHMYTCNDLKLHLLMTLPNALAGTSYWTPCRCIRKSLQVLVEVPTGTVGSLCRCNRMRCYCRCNCNYIYNKISFKK